MPGRKLGKACAYVLGQWPKLIRIFEFGDVELDTNWAEPGRTGDGQPEGCPKDEAKPSQNSWQLVLGRKNWLHVGSWEAGPRVAAIASVIESSKRLGINPRDYLAEVLPRLASGKMSDVPSLTPATQHLSRSIRCSADGLADRRPPAAAVDADMGSSDGYPGMTIREP